MEAQATVTLGAAFVQVHGGCWRCIVSSDFNQVSATRINRTAVLAKFSFKATYRIQSTRSTRRQTPNRIAREKSAQFRVIPL